MRIFLFVLAAVCAGVGVLFLTAAFAWMLGGGSGVTSWIVASAAPFTVAVGAGGCAVLMGQRQS